MELVDVIKQNSYKTVLTDQEEVYTISVAGEKDSAQKAKASIREVQLKALEEKILPARYMRNFGTVGVLGQKMLLESTVGIIGAGGLGGYIAEFLARMGVGKLIVIDDDIFEDSNLNRQLFSTEDNLFDNKAEAAISRIEKINSGVEVTYYSDRLTEENGEKLLSGSHVLVDALDNLSSRFYLEKTAKQMKIPFVHGAIGGFVGQVMTVFPEDTGLSVIYPKLGEGGPDKLMEVTLGNPTATPPMIASWQVHECVKIIVGIGTPLRNSLLYFDALEGIVEKIKLK